MNRHASLLALAAAFGCAAPQQPQVAPPPGTAQQAPALESPPAPAVHHETGLRFVVSPAEAQIAIDGNPAGAVADLAAQGGLLSLAPGIYQVSLKAPGHVTWRAEVALRAGTETIRVTLAKKP